MFKKNFDEGENKSSWFCEKYSGETKQESLLMGVLYSLKIRNGEDVWEIQIRLKRNIRYLSKKSIECRNLLKYLPHVDWVPAPWSTILLHFPWKEK